MAKSHRFAGVGSDALSPGSALIALCAVVSGVAVLLMPIKREPGLELWMFSPEHKQFYPDAAERWREQTGTRVNIRLFGIPALKRRMMGGFFAGVETADLIEGERQMVGAAFAGPVESIGFLDLTERIESEGLHERINPASFTPWMSRGRYFGLPHDVHPVLLGYRADIVEAAGIDMSRIETWEDFRRELAPLMADNDGDGSPDRYLLSFWESQEDNLEVLLLQGGGSMFDAEGRCTLASETNVDVLAEIISWCVGDDRFCIEINEWTSTGHAEKIDGLAIGYLMPDWMCGIWLTQIPQLAGKVKLMPLPAFEPGGRRTSVRGGSMMGIPKTSDNIEDAWAFAKELYLSRDLARRLFETTGIVTPVTELWDDPVFDEPQAYFSDQATGRLYIQQAPDVPARYASPYYRNAQLALRSAATSVAELARSRGLSSPDELRPLAAAALAAEQRSIDALLDRNAFLAESSP
ncbi:MAG: extracellular solute-binding protein [Phycisphaerales bacterium]